MAKNMFYFISTCLLLTFGWMIYTQYHPLWVIVPGLTYLAIGTYDLLSKHNILRLYPVIGHLRFIFEFIRPEIQQYFVATNLSGKPFNREQRSLVYQRSKNVEDSHPFGTEHEISSAGYILAQHSLNPKKVPISETRIMVGNHLCKKPYYASRINISAMSYGALGKNAILALNRGAKLGGFAHNTGEGGLTHYHTKEGGDIILQIGTGYFGMRDSHGRFCRETFKKTIETHANIKMIEIKLSQGAKPSHGGLLPKEKITAEIAKFRMIDRDKDCLSPAKHSEFSNPLELMHFIHELRELSGGLPIGFKLCIGIKKEFMSLCKAMMKTEIYPDFITVDGAEGGTGAAPVEFSNRLGTPINHGLSFVHNVLTGCAIRKHVKIIASGKIITSFDVALKLALGADLCNMARPMMFALGCIQSLHCNTNACPTGIATTDEKRNSAIDIDDKSKRVKNFHKNTMHNLLEVVGAMGIARLDDLKPHHFFQRDVHGHPTHLGKQFQFIEENHFYSGQIGQPYQTDWENASESYF